MQFIFDLIWTQSCNRYLAAMGQLEGRAVIQASVAVLSVISLAIFAAHALDAYRTG